MNKEKSILINFSDSLKDLMSERQLTCRSLGEKANLSSGSISMYRRACATPTINNLLKLAEFFDCSLEFLLGRANEKDHFDNSGQTSFIERLECLMKQQKTSFYRLSQECGLSESLYSDWKKGAMPLIDNLIAIADYFSVSVDYLLGMTNKK